MPAKKSTRSTRTRSKKVVAKKQNRFSNIPVLGKLISNKPALFIVLGVAALGVFLLFRAGAATTNFEAESAAQAGGAKSGLTDVAASGGKYAQFAGSLASSTASTQRFPGDPNPLVTGKAYWGASVGGNDDPTARHEKPTGKSLSLRRTFFGWGSRTTSMVTTAKNDLAANRLPWVSTKTPTNNPSDWAKMGNGTYDKEIDDMLIALDNIGGADKPVWLTVWHEPENDKGNAADWRAMQKRVRERINALKAQGKPMDNIAFAPILMSWTFHSSSGRNMNDWWVDGVWDFFGVDPYCYNACSSKGKTILTDNVWDAYITYLSNKKIPIGIGEWGETNKATVWAQVMKDVWAYGFNNKKDIVGYAAFDSGLNPPAGDPGVDTTMPPEVLAVFHDILKNDNRVQRVADLGKTTSTVNNFGTMTTNVTVPTSSTYKIWVRMNAPDANNNAVQLQVDSGTAMKVGDGGLTPNTWTWVDWKNGNTSDKVTTALSAGTRKITLTGIEPGVKIDRVLITDETCQPTGTGEECTVITPPATPPPSSGLNVSIVKPTSGQTISGVTQVAVEPATNVEEVSFRINGVWQTTDKDTPFTWTNWDTTKFPNGSNTVTIRARKVGDPGSKYTEKSVVVNVVNGTTSTQPVADTTPPTKPANLTAATAFSGTQLRYVMNLSWTPSTDNTGVTKYIVERDGTKLGEPTTNTFVDSTEISADKPYTYSVTALDAKNNASAKASMTVQSTCFLIWCTTSVL